MHTKKGENTMEKLYDMEQPYVDADHDAERREIENELYAGADNDDVLFAPTADDMTPVKLSTLRRGEYFIKKRVLFPSDSQVWVRGEYDRTERKYEIYRFDDVNRTAYLRGDTQVYTDFIF